MLLAKEQAGRLTGEDAKKMEELKNKLGGLENLARLQLE